MNGVSVVICCYNSAKRLPETLRHLALQQSSVDWELIVVDNACTDDTVNVAQREWESIGKSIPITVVNEPVPGLNYAREHGISAARFSTVILCDDDNHLMPGYVQAAFEIMHDYPEVGMAGGFISGDYEVEPEPWFLPHAHYLAIGAQASEEGDITKHPGILFGAGLVIRKSIYTRIKECGFQPIMTDRKKGSLMSGGDTEFCFAFHVAGARLFYSARLQMKHKIPASRISWEYLKKLQYFMGRGSPYFLAYFGHLMPDNPGIAKGWKRSWWWLYLTTWKELVKVSLSALKNGTPGSLSVMKWHFLRGRLDEILSVRSGLREKYSTVDFFVGNMRKTNVHA